MSLGSSLFCFENISSKNLYQGLLMEMIIEVLNKLASEGVELTVKGNNLVYKPSVNTLTKDIQNEVKKYKADIISLFKETTYWKDQLKGELPVYKLLPDIPSVISDDFDVKVFSRPIPNEICDWLNDNNLLEGISPSVAFLSLFKILLHKYTHQEDIVIGVPLSKGKGPKSIKNARSLQQIMPLRTRCDNSINIFDYFRTVKAVTIGASTHSYSPLSVIFKRINLEENTQKSLCEVTYEYIGNDKNTSNITTEKQANLHLDIITNNKSYIAKFTFNSALYSEKVINNLFEHFCSLILAVSEKPNERIGYYSIITAEEKQQVLVDFNQTSNGDINKQCLHDFFIEQVNLHANKAAVIIEDPEFGRQQLTYQELYQKSYDLALYLQSLGIKPDTLVGLCVERSLDLIIGIYGILLAGGAYVPLDPEYPVSRLQFILEDSQTNVILAQDKFKAKLAPLTNSKTQLITFDKDEAEIRRFSEHLSTQKVTLQRAVKPHHLAYVIYTSGSTGQPKGVMTRHSNVPRIVKNTNYVDVGADDIVLSLSSYVFDGSIFDFFTPLSNGASLIIIKDTLDLNALERECSNATYFLTAALFNSVVINNPNILKKSKTILVGGEELSTSHVEKALTLNPRLNLINGYGPTETTVFACHHKISATSVVGQNIRTIPIGSPIGDTQLYILDKNNNPQPIGVPGELHIAGEGLAKGYLNRAALTEEKFVDNPFIPNSKMYKSGDMARWVSSGIVEYLGRIDTQVKIRGFRIEMGEIETQLNLHEHIANCAVVVQGKGNNKQLIAFYVLQDAATVKNLCITKESFKTYLQQSMPDFMIPSTFICLEALPLSFNGKVDRRSLENKSINIESSQTFVAPRNDIEQQLAAIWAEILDLEVANIGVNDNFFELGGHSLMATQLLSRIRTHFAADLSMQSLFDNSNIADIGVNILNAGKSNIAPIKVAKKEGLATIPLSFAQQRLWTIDQLHSGSANYNVPVIHYMLGALDINQLESALKMIISRHEILRTIFPNEHGIAQQKVLTDIGFNLDVVDLCHLSEESARQQQAKNICKQEAAQPFDLANDLLIRGKVIRLTTQEHMLLLNMHHIITDGWSMGVLVKELKHIMEAVRQGNTPSLPTLPIQYIDYSVWQRNWLQQSDLLKEQLAYWEKQLKGIPESSTLGTDYPRGNIQSFAGASQKIHFDSQLTNGLKKLAQQQDSTLFMSLLTAFNVLFYRYTGQEDICIGSPIANRHYGETEGLIGMFINTLVLRTTVNENESYLALLAKVKNTCLSAYQHQDAPFEKVVERILPERNMSISPLFQVMFILQNAPMESIEELERDTSIFDMTVEFTETKNGLEGKIEYCTALYKQATILRLIENFTQLCKAIVDTPSAKIFELESISQNEKQQLLTDFNESKVDYPKTQCIHQLIAEQARINPEKIAVIYEEQKLSYQALDDKSDKLALYLQSQGVKPGSLVGLCVERSLDMMVAMIGILKAGGAYIPLDPSYPADRLSYMLEDSQASIVITQEALKANVATYTAQNTPIIAIDGQWSVIVKTVNDSKELNKETSSLASVSPDDLAYVIYTSGSTGKPKGVMVKHKGVVNFLSAMAEKPGIKANDKLLAITTFCFDIAVLELFLPLVSGAELRICSGVDAKDGEKLKSIITTYQPTLMQATPATWQLLFYSDWVNKEQLTILCGGEALPESLKKQFIATNSQAWNMFGPTETTIWSTIDLIKSDEATTIGTPIANTQIYILDPHNNVQPIGVAGELHIAGDGLAKGYLERDELTAEKFVDNPFVPQTLMYKSGDLARWLDNGKIEYLGRADTLVKIRGFRIETGEIEAQLNDHSKIKSSVVVAQGQDANKQLVAFYVPTLTTPDEVISLPSDDLKAYLQQSLPDYMVPNQFASITAIPLTPNGKVDRRALEAIEVTPTLTQDFLAPEDDKEQQVAEIWADILKIDVTNIGLNDNFFSLGGNSVNTVALAAKIQKVMACKFPPAALFKYSTIRSISQYISANTDTKYSIEASNQTVVANEIKPEINQEHSMSAFPKYYQDSLAIVGISCHLPEAEDRWQFWDNLKNGKESVNHLSLAEAEKHLVSADILNNPNYVATNAWLEGKDLFDPEFFKISSGNAELMDPQFRQLLIHSWKAVEDAGYNCEQIEKTSVFMSASNNFYQSLSESFAQQGNVTENSEEFMSWLLAQGGSIPTMISYQLGLKGPSVFVHTNCSSSLTALYSAYQSLQSKEVDYALVGAASLTASQKFGYIYQPGLNLSSDGRCKTFDANADGMVAGEGVSVMLVKRAEDAIAAGDNIYSLIRGISINNDGSDKAGFYAPSVKGQSSVIKQVLDKTQINPATINYVEAHGTGTALGDPIELMALSETYQEYTNKKQFCAIGSVKPNIGHLDTAAGLVGCIKLALSLYHKKFPPIINYTSANPQIDFENSPFYVLDQTQAWSKNSSNKDEPKRAAISSFGIGGTNAHAILEEYQPLENVSVQAGATTPTPSLYCIPLSAKKSVNLTQYAESLLLFIESQKIQEDTESSEINMARLAYTLQTGRKAMEHRVVFIVKTLDELIQSMKAFIVGDKSENYLRSDGNTDKKSTALLTEDEDYQTLVMHWLTKGKIDQLAKIWIKGTEIDWHALYANEHNVPLRMSLPTYPFTKDKYWHEHTGIGLQPFNRGALTATTTLHPLLHKNTSDLSQQSYHSRFTGQEFFLTDHQINEQKILPAVAYLEMIRAAVIQATPEQYQMACLDLTNIVWAQPIVVIEEKEINVVLSTNEHDEIGCQIYSVENTENGQPRHVNHCQGRAIFKQVSPPEQLNVLQLISQMKLGSEDINALYTRLLKMGVNFGPAHRAITAIHHGEHQLIAELNLPSKVANTNNDYILHPSIMDGALQACAALIAGANQEITKTTLPFALETLSVLAPCSQAMFAWIRYSAKSGPNEKLIKIDVDLCDSDGNICIQMKGFSSRVLSAGSLNKEQNASQDQVGTLLAAPVWNAISSNQMIAAINNEESSSLKRHVIMFDLNNLTREQMQDLLPYSDISFMNDTQQNMAKSYELYALKCFNEIQTIIKSKPQSKVLIQIVIANEKQSMLLLGLSGLLKTASLENPKLNGHIIVVDQNVTAVQLSQHLVAESDNSHASAIKFENSKRHLLQWQEITSTEEEIQQANENIAFKDHGVYVITGGLGALGALFTQEILQQTRHSQIVLTGRAKLSTQEFKTQVNAKFQKMIKQNTKEQADIFARIEYQQLDLNSIEQVQQLLNSIQKNHGQLSGIIHSAGMIADNFILKKTATEFSQVLAPKVLGTYNLDLASQELDLDFFALFSSDSSIGAIGQVDYAVANGFMNLFSHYRNQLVAQSKRHGKTVAINWPLWQNGGMSIDHASLEILQKTTGMRPLQTAAGISAFYRCLQLDQAEPLVLEGEITQLRDKLFSIEDIVEKSASPTIIEPINASAQTTATHTVIEAQPATSTFSMKNLVEETNNYLCKQFSTLFKISANQIDVDASLENYGIDSILAINLTNQLEKTFGSLSKTLLFEYQTVAELSEYFIESFEEKLVSLFALDVPSKSAAMVKHDGVTTINLPIDTSTNTSISTTSTSNLVSEKTGLFVGGRFNQNSQQTQSTPSQALAEKAIIDKDPIAIIGLSGCYPEAADTNEYWDNLRDGKDCITEVPLDRWDWREYYSEDRTKAGHHYSKWGGFMPGVDEFDPLFFNISPREAVLIDPQERLFLQQAWMAMEDAGYTRADLRIPSDRTLAAQVGVYVGVMYGEYQLFGAEASLQGKRMGFASNLSDIANRVSYVLNIHGPSMVLDTQCSSSLTAIHLACQDLKAGQTDLAIAGGVNISIHANKYLMLSSGQFISSHGHCQSFGEGGDGYIPGEGVGAVILKRLREAEQDGDHIYGLIKGSSIGHGGKTNGYSVPNPQAQADVITQALRESNTDPRHISYLEAHGTGTKLGDPIEITALSKAFYRDLKATNTEKSFGFCLLGSAKSNIGHCEPAAGIAGLTKVLLQMKNKKIVPSLHSSALNPHIDFDKTPFIVNQKLTDWSQPVIDGKAIPRIAGISSFGAGGANAHMVIEEYQSTGEVENTATPLESHTNVAIVLSARIEDQLKEKVKDLLVFIRRQTDKPLDLTAMAYTLQTGREAMEERLGFLVNSVEQLEDNLQAYIDGNQTTVDNIFQGQVKRNREGMSIISHDDDMKEAIDKWIARKKLPKLLDLWVKGLNLQWSKLYGEQVPKRMSLPTYPFAKTRYWIDTTAENQERVNQQTAVIHPLLHTNTSDLEQQSYSTTFSGSESYLAETMHAGEKLLPAVCHLEMARAAIEQAMPTVETSSILEFHHTVWGQPVTVTDQSKLSIALFAKRNQAVDFEIYSEDEDIVHSQGHAIYSSQPAPAQLNIQQLKQQMNTVDISSLGQEFTTCYQGDKQLLVELSSMAGSDTQSSDFILHPDIMNAALKVSLALVVGENTSEHIPTLPVMLDTIRIIFATPHASNNSTANGSLVWIRYADGSNGIDGSLSGQIKLDIDVCDEQGYVCVQMRGLTYKTSSVDVNSETSKSIDSSVIQTNKTAITYPALVSFLPTKQQDYSQVAINKPIGIPLIVPSDIALTKRLKTSITKGVVALSDTTLMLSNNAKEPTRALVNLVDNGNGVFAIKLIDTVTNNVLTHEVIEQIVLALRCVEKLSTVKVLLLQGSEQHFLSGSRHDYNNAVALQLYQAIVAFPYPIIAVLEGEAKGAGFLVASLCDFMIANQDANYGYTNLQANIYPEPSEIRLLEERFNHVLANDLLFSAEVHTGQALQVKGWTCPIVPADEVLDYANKLALNLAAKSQNSLRQLKGHLSRHLQALVNDLTHVEIRESVSKVSVAKQKLSISGNNITVNYHNENILQITLTKERLNKGINSKEQQQTEPQVLLAQLTKVMAQVNDATDIKALVLTSEYEEFIPALGLQTDVDVISAFQDLLLGVNVPIIAALEHNASNAALLISQCCDATIYSNEGQYSFGQTWNTNSLIQQASMVFSYRFGPYVAKEMALTTSSYSGAELAKKVLTLKAVEQGNVIVEAIKLAEFWQHWPIERIIAYRAYMRTSIQDEVTTLPEWFNQDNAVNTLTDNQNSLPTEIRLNSGVVKAKIDPMGILIVELADKQAKNMFSDALVDGINEVFEHINETAAYKAVVLTGYDSYFSTGGTKENLLAIQEGKIKFTDSKVYHAALNCQIPVIAAMQGHGIGAGWALGMFADFVLFSEESKYLSPYMNLGFTPGAGATLVFPEKIGYDLARETLLTAQEYSGSELKARGLSLPVLARADILSSAMDLAKQIAQNSREYLIAVKHQMIANIELNLAQTYGLELEMHEKTFVGRTDTLQQIENNFTSVGSSADQKSFEKMALQQVVLDQTIIEEQRLAQAVNATSNALSPTALTTAEVSQASLSVDSSNITASLKGLLAAELHMQDDEIDEEAQFVDLGLDSIYGVTWVRKINEKYSLTIEAIKVYSYPTLTEFSSYVSELLTDQNSNATNVSSDKDLEKTIEAVPKVDTRVATQTIANAMPSTVAQITLPLTAAVNPTVVSVPMQVSTSVKSTLGSITSALKKLLAHELHMPEEDVDEDAQFVDLGLDSIYGVTWVRKINEKYGLAIEAIKVYSYPTLTEFSSYVKEEAEKQGTLIGGEESIPENAPAQVMPEVLTQQPTTSITFTAPIAVATSKTNIQSRTSQGTIQLKSWRKSLASKRAISHGANLEQIAVIGIAGQFPKANNLDEYWDNIAEGRNCISQIPDGRWDIETFYQEGDVATGKTNSKWIGALEEYDLFDPLFFNISPLEAESMDPQQRVFLQTCWHGIENAGYNAKDLSGSKCGVFVGCGHGDYNQLSEQQKLSAHGFTGGASSILSARISYFLNLQGPCLSIDTACSSSLVAIANACDSLSTGASDIALAGGVYVMTGPQLHIRTAQSGMLSSDGRCYSFDQRANGFVPGEGVGVVMLKRLADAQNDKDIIQGVVQGWGVNQDGKTNGITAPNPVSQTRLQQEVYDRHQIDPSKIQLIEAHGTGTKLGDPIEIEGLKQSFKKYTEKKDYCALSSVKSNIGHSVTAAGVAGFIKVILALKHKQLPPTINFTELNEHIELKDSPFYINNRLQEWQVDETELRQAAISSFGFSGTNAHIVISEYKAPVNVLPMLNLNEQPAQVIIPLSAKSPEQLMQRARDLLAFTINWQQKTNAPLSISSLSSMAYTLQNGREMMDERLSLIVNSVEQLVEKLQCYIAGEHIDDVYQGQVDSNKESMRLISHYDDVKDTIVAKWINSNNLSKLADLWVKGLDFDWNKLYGETKPLKMTLPVYPFTKTRYWIDTNDIDAAKANNSLLGNTLLTKGNVLHPLVHNNISNFSQQKYSTNFSGEEFFLKDHRVQLSDREEKVLPGVAYLEMIRVAVENAIPTSQTVGILELNNVAWVQPMVANKTKSISINLFENDEEQENSLIDYEIYSEESGQELLHCQGHAGFSNKPVPAQFNVNALKEQMKGKTLTRENIYNAFKKSGLNYGPAHQGIISVHRGEQEVLAQVRLPKVIEGCLEDYWLHPSIMDSALQASVGLLPDLELLSSKPSVPFALEKLRIISACTEEMYVWLRHSADSQAGSKLMKLDVDIIDQQGNVCVQMQGFTSRTVTGRSLSVQSSINSNLYQDSNEFELNALEHNEQEHSTFDDAFYEKVIDGVLDNKISVEEAMELGNKI